MIACGSPRGWHCIASKSERISMRYSLQWKLTARRVGALQYFLALFIELLEYKMYAKN